MTEVVNGASPNQDVGSSAPVQTSSPSSAQSAPSPTGGDERTFRQSDVNEIVKKAKNEAVDSYRRLQQDQPAYFQQKYGEAAPQREPSQTANTIPGETDYRRIAAEEAQRLRDEWVRDTQAKSEAENAQRTVQNFYNKISAGKEKYDDFDSVTGDIQFGSYPNVVQLLEGYVDNADDVLYELGNNRFKMAGIESLAERSSGDAIREIQRLSASLKKNAEAQNRRVPNEPLSQLRPSNTGTDNGEKSVKDYRRIYKG